MERVDIRTAESVSPMHPDKICDQVSDAVLDACLAQDPLTRAGIETLGSHGIVTVTGEVTTSANVDFREVARNLVGSHYGVQVNIVQQSSEIARGVDEGGAGDQGIMVGYACRETDDFIPLEVYLSRNLCKYLFEKFPYDGKTQITLRDGYIESVVASFQNSHSKSLEGHVRDWLNLQNKVLPSVKIFTNPAGEWVLGGFEADAGLTGRKLVVDNYGPRIPIGGGCFSGKDPSKVDRSAAYMARKIAIDWIKKSGANEVFCHLAYSIGVARPVMAVVSIDGKQEEVTGYDLSPKGIIDFLDLRRPQYEKTASWGHFGNNFNWDK